MTTTVGSVMKASSATTASARASRALALRASRPTPASRASVMARASSAKAAPPGQLNESSAEILHHVGDHLDLAPAQQLGRRIGGERPREDDEAARRRCPAATAAASPAGTRARASPRGWPPPARRAGSMWLMRRGEHEDHGRHGEVHEPDQHAALREQHGNGPGDHRVAEDQHPRVGAHDGPGEEGRQGQHEQRGAHARARRCARARRPPG